MKIVIALVLVACVAVQAAPAKKVKGECRRMSLCPSVLKKKDGKLVPVLQKDKCTFMYWFCPADAHGKVDSKHCKKVKKCGGGKGKWVKVGDDGHDRFEGEEDDGDHKHKKCKKHKKTGGDDDDDDEDKDGDRKKHKKCKKHKKNHGSDDDDSGSDGSGSDSDHGCKKHHSDGSDDSDSD